jgi:Peptide N-acetyl-beta-D-glucosaminyl asparaginase amidase A
VRFNPVTSISDIDKRTRPPSDCGPAGSWAGVSLNFTVTSNGTQYDRLGTFTLDDVESMPSTLKYKIYDCKLFDQKQSGGHRLPSLPKEMVLSGHI